MDKEKMSLFLALDRYKKLFKLMGINPSYFLFSALLYLSAAFLEGAGVALLLPLARGVIHMNFNFVRDNAVLKPAIDMLSRFLNITDFTIFLLLIAVVFAAMLLKNIFKYLASISVAYLGRRFSNNMKKAIFNRYLSFGKAFFDKNNEGYLHNLVVDFTHIISQRIIFINTLLSNLFMFVVYIILMFTISWKLTVFIILFSPVSYFSVRWLIERIRATSKSYASARNILSRKLFNVLSCIPLVKANASEDKEKEEFSRMAKDISTLEFSIDKKYYLLQPVQEVMMFALMLLLVVVVGLIVVKSGQDVSGFLVYFYLLRRLVIGLDVFNNFKGSLAIISGPMAEVSKIIDDKDKFFVKDGNKKFEGLRKSIDFKNLNFHYHHTKPILSDIAFSIEKGKVTAIVGPTGVGKTTLINLIMRFYDCPPSSILLDGVDIRQFSIKSLMGHIALVSQDTFLFNDTLKKNITYGANGNITEEKIMAVLKKARLYDFVMSLPEKLDVHIGDRGIKLSGGEKQRVSIARALLKGAEILILDEATSSLDTNTEKLVQETVAEVIKDKTSIVIAHRLSTIKHADKIVVIDDGKLVEEGSLQELLEKKGRFYRYWEDQKFY